MIQSVISQIKAPPTAREVIRDYKESLIAKKESNDCCVRALAVVEDLNYDEAHLIAASQMRRKFREGVTRKDLVEYFVSNRSKYKIVATEPVDFSDPLVLKKLRSGAYLKNTYPNGKKCAMSVGTFSKKCSKGRFFVVVRGHAFAVVNGKVIGNRNDHERTRAIVLCAFKLKD